MSGSTGRSPRSGENATRGAVVTGSIDTSEALITPRRSAMSATVRPIGPVIGWSVRGSGFTSWGMDPVVGRKPTTALKAAGFRSEPPRSEPSAMESEPQASPTAAPPLDPPALRVGSHGLRVSPRTGLKVWEPFPNSGVLVLPTGTTPHRRRWAIRGASSDGTRSSKTNDPRVVRTPAVSTRSLKAVTRPRRGSPSNRVGSLSSRLARRSAVSQWTVGMALTTGSVISARVRQSAKSSRHDALPVSSSTFCSVAVNAARSIVGEP